MESSHILSSQQRFGFSLSYLTPFWPSQNVFFLNEHKVSDVIKVCWYCWLILLFLACFPIKGWSNQSRAAFFTPLGYLCWRRSFCSHTFFLKNTWIFLGLSFCSSFVRHLCQKCGWAVSEPYMRLHIIEPPCLYLLFVNFTSFFLFDKVDT